MIERSAQSGLDTLILQALVRKLIAKQVLTSDDVRGLLFDVAMHLDVVGGEQTPQAARIMVEEDLAPLFLGGQSGSANDPGAGRK